MALPRTSVLVVAVALVSGALAGPAAGSGSLPCSSLASSATAKVVSGTLLVNDFTHPITRIGAGAPLKYGYGYRAATAAQLSWLGNTAAARAGTYIGLSCYGLSVSLPARNPMLSIHAGALSVHAAGGTPLGVATHAGLVGPVPGDVGKTVLFWVQETSSATSWPTTTVRVTSPTPRINVTPYVGPRPGSCRVVTSATLVYDPNNAGTASYALAG